MSTIAGYEVHPDAELFPLIRGDDFEALVQDINENGQMEPVVLDRSNRLIDGRNRARACERLGLPVVTKVYDGDDVLQFVISCNLHRRHLTDSQRAMIAAALAERKAGQREGERYQGHMDPIPPSIADASEMLGVSENSTKRAKQVIRDGVDELKDLVADGSAPVATAARVATTLEPEQQREYVEQVKAGADPVKAAPPPNPPKAQPRPDGRPPKPTVYGTRRKHAEMLDALIVGLGGYSMGLAEITELDASVTAEEAARLTDDLSESIRSLNRINKLLKERTAP